MHPTEIHILQVFANTLGFAAKFNLIYTLLARHHNLSRGKIRWHLTQLIKEGLVEKSTPRKRIYPAAKEPQINQAYRLSDKGKLAIQQLQLPTRYYSQFPYS